MGDGKCGRDCGGKRRAREVEGDGDCGNTVEASN